MKRIILTLLFLLSITSSAFAAWTVTVTQIATTDNQELRIDVQFNDGVSKPFPKSYLFRDTSDASTQLISRVRDEIAIQDAVKTSKGKITLGPLNIPVITPPTTDPELTAFLTALSTYRHTKNSFDAGVATQKELDDAKTDLKSKNKPEYLIYY